MSGLRLHKQYNAIVTMSNENTLEYDVEVYYEDDDSMCIPDIDVSITANMIEGLAGDFEDDIEDGLDTYFTKDACQTEDGEDVFFVYDTDTDKFEVVENDGDTNEAIIEKAIKQMQQEIADGDLTCIEGLLQVIPIKTIKDYLVEED
jgi:hypothetical protein